MTLPKCPDCNRYMHGGRCNTCKIKRENHTMKLTPQLMKKMGLM